MPGLAFLLQMGAQFVQYPFADQPQGFAVEEPGSAFAVEGLLPSSRKRKPVSRRCDRGLVWRRVSVAEGLPAGEARRPIAYLHP